MSFGFTYTDFPVLHPVGNIAEFLLGAGLAHFVEWHSGMLAPYGGSEKLRAADRAAKQKRLCLHANAAIPSAIERSLTETPNGTARLFEGTIVRVWSGDQVSIAGKDGKERRVQLSSTRGPKYIHSFSSDLGRILTTQRTGCQTPNRRTTLKKLVNSSGKS
jgi:hypothetical protein